MSDTRQRLRSHGISVGHLEPGPHNAITDVSGVLVGHTTLIAGAGTRTGVTAIRPNAGDVFNDRLVGGAFILNGAGELSGLLQVQEWGVIETPILLTNTLDVGAVSSGCVQYMLERFPGIGKHHDVIIPLVGECDDSYLNDIAGRHVSEEHVYSALANAAGGPVAEGNVGGGTGMVSFDLKGGIGTSSRRLDQDAGGDTVGVLVMSNCGKLRDLRIDGFPVGRWLQDAGAATPLPARRTYGSIIAVLATDAPLNSHQLERLCKRVALGIGRVGSYAAHHSGEIVLGFSTANRLPRTPPSRTFSMEVLSDAYLDPLYEAAIEATEEAMLNAMCLAEPMTGADGHHVPALPMAEVSALLGARTQASGEG